MKKPNIWTNGTRSLLYSKLVQRFGPYKSWGHKHHPKLQRREYEEFLKSFATLIGAKSSGAIQMQIEWSIGRDFDDCEYHSRTYSKAHSMIYWQNKVIAYECGFIDYPHFPDSMTVEYNIVNKNFKTDLDTPSIDYEL